jgi:O-acetyl-ADP-ribose deacetylase (regulator of RNase III)
MIHRLGNVNLLDWLDEQKVKTAIAHQANCFHTFGAGIARQIVVRYPEAYEADKKTPYGSAKKLGHFSFAPVKADPENKFVFNIYGQYGFGNDDRSAFTGADYDCGEVSEFNRNTSYDAVLDGLERYRKYTSRHEFQKIGIPYNMGCMLGGGDWEIVNKLVEIVWRGNHLSGPDLYICRYEPKR